MVKAEANMWRFSTEHREPCCVIEEQELWGETTCQIWLPSRDVVLRVPAESLKPIDVMKDNFGSAHLTYIASAARIADALARDVLLAPVESAVIPLPHQIRALSKAMSDDRVRYLLADEVGLGKTIEAGLIMRELKVRGLVERTLVVVPRSLVIQWIAEMRMRFDEEFRLVIPRDLESSWTVCGDDNPWRALNQVVCTMDSVKPIGSRFGWSDERVAEYNRTRFQDLISAGWDLIIVDEAHRLAGSTEQVARYKLGRGLAEAAPYLLLLTATPHQGKTDAFQRLLSLVDERAFPDVTSVSRERIEPYVIRTEKRHAIDEHGQPLFKSRHTQLVPVAWTAAHRQQQLLYEAVTDYVREGYNQAMREKKTYIGFLMILMQRLVSSSTRAIARSLERRLEALALPEEQLALFPTHLLDEWSEVDGQAQADSLLSARLSTLSNERDEVELLLEAAREVASAGPDAKADALLEWIYRLQQEERDPNLKILVFTEFVSTQEMLRDFLTERGFSVVWLNGSMGLEERQAVQDEFAKSARIMISTEVGGEGLNLQFCHVVINYDIPWNPMRLEQRIGRVDRIGQDHPVRAINFVLEHTVEHRVREVLEHKLDVILQEFGVDKIGDVLDSAASGRIFDDLYVQAILDPQVTEANVDRALRDLEEQAGPARERTAILGPTQRLAPRDTETLLAHPLPYWVERMTVSYLEAYGGKAEQASGVWVLTWPDGEHIGNAVFTAQGAAMHPSATHLTLENSQIRKLVKRLPPFVPGQPIPCTQFSTLPEHVEGFWALWRVALRAQDWQRWDIMSLFLHDDGRVLMPTAHSVWDEIIANGPGPHGFVTNREASAVYDAMREAAETYGKDIYEGMAHSHQERLEQEQEKGEHSFATRRRAIERIGLPAVRNHRLAQLEAEENAWRVGLNARVEAMPELEALAIIRVDGGKRHA